ncbi:MAG: hypothetical protein ACOC41_03695 [Chitinivibrionales bacterium]
MRFSALITLMLIGTSIVSYAQVAVFPPHGVNTDKSFVEAFGVLLANKYRSISGEDVISPRNTARAIAEDRSFAETAQELGAKEYLEIEAVGLYLSRKERADYSYSQEPASKTIIVKLDDDDDPDDQELLDNHKTIVTVSRRNAFGKEIHIVEMTLLTYGDIEESTDRIARALFQKVSVEEVRTVDNITRREGMGNNKMFTENIKGLKFGVFYPGVHGLHIVDIVTIGYNHRIESEKIFFEFGVNAKIPTSFKVDEERVYGGVQFELGGNYFVYSKFVGVYTGIGVAPFLSIGEDESIFQIGIVPFLQVGASFPRNSPFRGFVSLKVGQNVLPITTGTDRNIDYYYYDEYEEDQDYPHKKDSYPTEIGIEFGIGF